MTPAPSSPVPAVEAERIEALGRLIASVDKHSGASDLVITTMARDLRTIRPILAAAMSTPTPGRAAEPDTMGEVTSLVKEFRGAVSRAADALQRAPKTIRSVEGDHAFAEAVRVENEAETALLSAVRTIVTRTETAEAQLATRRAEVEGLRKLSNKATPYPWYREKRGKNFRVSFRPELAICQTFGDSLAAEEDSEFIVAAVNFVRTLLSTSGADR